MSELKESREEWIKRWVDALRSGEYKQGKGYLHNSSDEFCCLGVLSDLAVKEGVMPKWELVDAQSGPLRSVEKVYACDGAMRYMPDAVMELVGLNSTFGSFYVSDGGETAVDSLAARNDQGNTFEQIAWLIASRPRGLFMSEEEK